MAARQAKKHSSLAPLHSPVQVKYRLERCKTHFCAKLRDGSFLVTGDNDRFWNHSTTPNCLTGEDAQETVAIRDIQAGEELTDNYLQYCDDIEAPALQAN